MTEITPSAYNNLLAAIAQEESTPYRKYMQHESVAPLTFHTGAIPGCLRIPEWFDYVIEGSSYDALKKERYKTYVQLRRQAIQAAVNADRVKYDVVLPYDAIEDVPPELREKQQEKLSDANETSAFTIRFMSSTVLREIFTGMNVPDAYTITSFTSRFGDYLGTYVEQGSGVQPHELWHPGESPDNRKLLIAQLVLRRKLFQEE
jgi:uncharacterized protein DUF5753